MRSMIKKEFDNNNLVIIVFEGVHEVNKANKTGVKKLRVRVTQCPPPHLNTK